MVCAGCDLSRGRRGIAGHGCEVWAGLGWSRAGSREWLWVEHGRAGRGLSGSRLTRASVGWSRA